MLPSAPVSEPTPPKIDGYEILGEIGRGGVGVVYRAREAALERTVAVKAMAPAQLHGESAALLRRDAERLAAVRHVNVVRVFEVGEHGGAPYLVMEYVPGPSAKAWLAEEPSPTDVYALLMQAGRGLAAAHERGVLHLDFKLASILVGPGQQAKVTDFGVARLADSVAVPGTPAYMAPERFSGVESEKVDQFAFGATMLEALCGRPVFADGVASQRDEGELARALQRLPKGRASQQTLYVLRRACAFDPAHRWNSMSDLLDALPPPPRRDRVLMVGMLGAVIVAGVAAWAASKWYLQPDPCDAVRAELTSSWSDETRSDVATRSGGRFLVEHIDTAAEAWAYQRETICQVTGDDHPVDALDLRVACLDHSWATLSGALEVVRERPDAAVAYPTAVTATLPDPLACADLEALRSGAPPFPSGLASTQTAIARARVLEGLGDLQAAMAALDAAAPDVRASEYGPLQASWEHRRGSVALGLSDLDTAEPLLKSAFERARALKMPALASYAAQDLATLASRLGTRPADDAERWLQQAAAMAEGASPPVRRRLRTTQAQIAKSHGDLAGALVAYEQAAEVSSTDPLADAELLEHTAVVLRQLGRVVEANDAMRRVWDLYRTALSNDHPLANASEERLGTPRTQSPR